MIRTIIADDHSVLRQALASLLAQMESLEVIAQANNGLELLPLVEQLRPELVILDLSMPGLGGLESIHRMQKMSPKPQILVLSAKEDEISVSEALHAGANGYVPKSSGKEELQFAISAVLKGQTYLSPAIASSVLNYGDGAASSPLAGLSVREREVMKLLSEGRPNREVAKLLHLSPRTIDSHRANIMRKLGITSNAELVQLAIKSGLVEA